MHAGPDKCEFIAVNMLIVPHLAAGYLLEDKDCSLLSEGSHFEGALVGDSHREVGFLLYMQYIM